MPFEREHREAELVAVALGKLAVAHRLQQQRQMHEFRHRVRPSESLIKEHMERSRRKPFLAAYHMAHLHQVVVHYVGEMIGRQPVRALVKHLVIKDVAHYLHLAAYKVVDHHLAPRLDLETHHILAALVHKAFHLLGRHSERIAHPAARRSVVLEIGRFGTCRVKLFRRVEGKVRLAGIEEAVHVAAVDLFALALLIRAVLSALAHTFIDADAEPCERLIDVVFRAGDEATAVCVLDAQNHLSAVGTREKVIVEGSADTAYVKRPCGRRCESHPYWSFHKF